MNETQNVIQRYEKIILNLFRSTGKICNKKAYLTEHDLH